MRAAICRVMEALALVSLALVIWQGALICPQWLTPSRPLMRPMARKAMPKALRKKAEQRMAMRQLVALAAPTDPAVRGRAAGIQPGLAPGPVAAWSQMWGPVGP